MATEQVSTYGTGEQPSIMEVDNSPISATNATDSILLPLAEIPKLCRIGFERNLTESTQVKKNNNCRT